MSDDLMKQHIRAALQFEEDFEKRREAVLADWEAKGYRLVDGGQTGPDTWDVTDHRTGATIAEGSGGIEGHEKVITEQGAMWAHIDPITEHLYDDPQPVTEGLPESLCKVLSDWAEQADGEEIRAVLG